jgi:hypothetical protein
VTYLIREIVLLKSYSNSYVKVELEMLPINYHTVKTYGRTETKLQTLLTSALDGRDLSAPS